MATLYIDLGIESFVIKNTRSKHKDTDYIVFLLKIGTSAPQTDFKYLGDVNSGTFPVNLRFSSYPVNTGDQVVVNYMIVNAGSTKPGAAQTALQNAAIAWASGQGPASKNFIGALQDGQTWFNDELKSILNHNSCDGMVAAEQDHFTYDDLTSLVANGTHTQPTNHPGIRSPSGCGPNSQYTVTWSISPGAKLI